MGRRVAVVVSADGGEELRAGWRDAGSIFHLLIDPELGCCDPASPKPVTECTTREQFHRTWDSVLSYWHEEDQLLFYFSGHGVIKHDRYTLAFGASSQRQYVPFDSLIADLQSHGVKRAILLLDACSSGAALKSGFKGEDRAVLAPVHRTLPVGVVLLASSLHNQSSFERADGLGSVFTHLLVEGIKTGLGGLMTEDDLIGPDDLIHYINTRLQAAEYRAYPQRAVYQVSSAERNVWISRNRTTRPVVSPAEPQSTHLRKERSRPAVPGADASYLDWTLVRRYADATGKPMQENEPREHAAARLGLLSWPESLLHNAAVLCFSEAPHLLLQQARSILVRGSRTGSELDRVDIFGPLSRQVELLHQLSMEELHHRLGWQATGPVADLLGRAIREAVSNAVTHRDYASTQVVRVTVHSSHIEITNPGTFRAGVTFEKLLASGDVSEPTDPAIALYLTTLLTHEGIGRGFAVFRACLAELGSDSIQCNENRDFQRLRVTIRIPEALRLVRVEQESLTESVAISEAHQGRIHTGNDLPSGLQPRRRYELLQQLGDGSLGKVYLGRHEEFGVVAIKILSTRFGTVDNRATLQREAGLLARLNHPSIVTVYDVYEFEERVFMIMEYVEGFDLKLLLADTASLNKREFPQLFDQIALIILDLAEGLDSAHEEHVIHRDVRPGNVRLGLTGRARILEFGVSLALEANGASGAQPNVAVGTPQYMSPEQLRGARIDGRSDVYSLGVMMYELLTGRLPFVATSLPELAHRIETDAVLSPREIEPAVPDELSRICLRAMERDLAARYLSADYLVEDLARYLGSVTTEARSRVWRDVRERLRWPDRS